MSSINNGFNLSSSTNAFNLNQQEYQQGLEKLTTGRSRYLWIDAEGHVSNIARSRLDNTMAVWDHAKKFLGLESSQQVVKTRAINFLEYGIGKGWVSRTQVKRAIAHLNLDGSRADITRLQKMAKEIPMTKDEAVATLRAHIKAHMKGAKTRDAVVLPSQIRANLEKSIHSFYARDTRIILKVICREIAKMALDPDKYKGKSIKISEFTKKFPKLQIPLLLVTYKRTTTLDCSLEMSDDGKKVGVRLTPSIAPLGVGIDKVALASQFFEIDLRLLKATDQSKPARKMQYTPQVVLRQTKDSNKTSINVGAAIQKQLRDLQGTKIAGTGRERSPDISGRQKAVEVDMEWYNCDLLQAIEASAVPLSFDISAEKRPLKFLDKLNIVSDVAQTIKTMHAHRFIYGDPKSLNVLIGVESDGSLGGYLTDFDTASMGSCLKASGTKGYIDDNGDNGWITPHTDCYGLIAILAETFVEDGYRTVLAHPEFINSEESIRSVKEDILMAYAKKNLKGTNFANLGTCKTRKERDTHFRMAEQRASNQSTKFLKNLKKELDVIEDVVDLIVKVMKQSKEAGKFLMENPDLVKLARTDDEYASTENGELKANYYNELIPLTPEQKQALASKKADLLSRLEALPMPEQITAEEICNMIDGFRRRLA